MTCEFEDTEEWMSSWQQKLQNPDPWDSTMAVVTLMKLYFRLMDPLNRCVILEVITGARTQRFEYIAANMVEYALDEPNEDIRFTAIACASDLSRQSQRKLKPKIRALADNPSLASAAHAFLNSLND